MKLLLVCQVLDHKHPNLGFFHRWVEEYARRAESVTVIASAVGEYALPAQVVVFSLGKERGVGRLGRLARFFSLVVRHRGAYDAVFVHMVPEFAIAGAPFWRLFKKKIGLWYVHGRISLRLRLAAFLVDYIFTASPESCRIRSPKVHIVGHGIMAHEEGVERGALPRIVSVSRISPSKKLETILDTFAILKKSGVAFEGELIGGPLVEKDRAYARTVEERARALGIRYSGALTHPEAIQRMREASFFISASATGSVDKAVLEAAAVGAVPIFSSPAFVHALNTVGLKVDGDPRSYAGIIRFLMSRPDLLERYRREVRQAIVERHSLQQLIPRMMALYERA